MEILIQDATALKTLQEKKQQTTICEFNKNQEQSLLIFTPANSHYGKELTSFTSSFYLELQ